MNGLSTNKKLGVFVLAMMNVAVVMSLRGIPMIAKTGLPMIFFLLFSVLVFLIPVSLISAELATGWYNKGGGVYQWVKEAFGDRCGFLAIWLQWMQNVIWFPTVLAFAAGALGYLFLQPTLVNSNVFTFFMIIIIYWVATLVNLRGLKLAGKVTTSLVIIGTIIPAILIIVLGVLWIAMGNPIEFLKTSHSIIPDFSNFGNISFLAGIVLLFAGMEVSAAHVREVRNPRKDYPKAILLSVLIIFVLFLIGSIALAAAVPADVINLDSGLMQGFKVLLNNFGIGILLPFIGLLVACGAVGGVIAWIAGPSKGVCHTAEFGDIPPIMSKRNKAGVQINLLIIQGLIVTALASLFLIIPSVNDAFFILTILTAVPYLIMYLMLFATGVKLRYSHPEVERAYKVPGGNAGMWLLSGVGTGGILFAIVFALFPPAQLPHFMSQGVYVALIIGVTAAIILAALIINYKKKPGWTVKTVED